MTDDVEVPEGLAWMLGAVERTRAVACELVRLDLHDANELAARSECPLREVRRDGKGSVVTADWRANRINLETENGVVVEASVG